MVPFVVVFSLVVCAQLISLSSQESFRPDPIDDNKLLKVRISFSSFSSSSHDFFVWRVKDCVDVVDGVWKNPRLYRPLTTWYIQPLALQSTTTAPSEIVQVRVEKSSLADVDSRSDVSHSEALVTESVRTKITNAVTTLSSGRYLPSFAWTSKV